MGNHIFISYSRRDSSFVDTLSQRLQDNDIAVWVDTHGLEPGTPNWEQSIRHAIEDASAVLLVASPSSRQSVFVQGELSLANLHQCPVYPVWVNGDEWIEAIPLGMVNYQYIDCREENLQSGIRSIIDTMKSILDTSSTITISLASHERIQINIDQFGTALDALNHLYLNYLQGWYLPFTYGIDWVLGNIETKELAVPWDWLSVYDVDLHGTGNFPLWYLTWGKEPPSIINFEPNSVWAMWEVQRLRVGGIAVNSKPILDRLLSKYGQRELSLMVEDNLMTKTTSEAIDPGTYQYSKVIALMNLYPSKTVFVET